MPWRLSYLKARIFKHFLVKLELAYECFVTFHRDLKGKIQSILGLVDIVNGR